MSDQEIIHQLKEGNESSLKHLYQHLDMVKSWVLKNNGNDEDALDIFQEAMIVFYKNLMNGTYQQKSKISTYLFSICKRQWLNQLNRRLKYEQPNSNYEQLDSASAVDSFEIEITNAGPTLKRYINKALENLGEPCKSLIEASVYLKLKMQVIAEKFKYADAHSARQQKLRCLKRLRKEVSYETIIKLR